MVVERVVATKCYNEVVRYSEMMPSQRTLVSSRRAFVSIHYIVVSSHACLLQQADYTYLCQTLLEGVRLLDEVFDFAASSELLGDGAHEGFVGSHHRITGVSGVVALVGHPQAGLVELNN